MKKVLPTTYGALFAVLDKPLPEGVNAKEPVCLWKAYDGRLSCLLMRRARHLWGTEPSILERYGDEELTYEPSPEEWQRLGISLSKIFQEDNKDGE